MIIGRRYINGVFVDDILIAYLAQLHHAVTGKQPFNFTRKIALAVHNYYHRFIQIGRQELYYLEHQLE